MFSKAYLCCTKLGGGGGGEGGGPTSCYIVAFAETPPEEGTLFKYQPCIRRELLKFKLTNQNSASGKNCAILVLSDVTPIVYVLIG